MPVPLLPLAIGAAGAALLFAGHAEDKKATSPGGAGAAAEPVNATPTQQTTGGPQGGAQSPSHADIATQTVSALDQPIESVPEKATIAGAAGITVGAPEHVTDVWAPSPGPSLDVKQVEASGGALGAIAEVGALTGKAAAQAFEVAGTSYGSMWGWW